MLIDDNILLLGSMNFSSNSLDKNREIWILLIDQNLIKVFKNQFDNDRINTKK
jgi:phosphatidylserine/phosphatidylglycerophosphate/cardiolipin synthase-like enzyme